METLKTLKDKIMRIETKEVKVFSFEDLKTNEGLKKKVLERYANFNVELRWWDCIYEDVKTIGEFMGIDIDNIYFSGFYSQGDGACFTGHYSYAQNSINNIKRYAPEDKELYRIVKELQELQKKHFYQLIATIKHSGHYYHSNCTDIYIYKDGNYADSQELETLLRNFMDWIYEQLKGEYEYFTSEKSILETLEINGYEFTEDGKIY